MGKLRLCRKETALLGQNVMKYNFFLGRERERDGSRVQDNKSLRHLTKNDLERINAKLL